MDEKASSGLGASGLRVLSAGRLRQSLAEAAEARRLRTERIVHQVGGEISGNGQLAFRLRATDLLEESLTGPMPKRVDFAQYLERVVTRLQMSANRVRTVSSCLMPLLLTSRVARALAVLTSDIVQFVDASVEDGGDVHLYLAVAEEDGRLVVALAVVGNYALVPSAEAMRGLLRAGAIAGALGGCFVRGVESDRMVFGVTFAQHRRASRPGDADAR